MITRRTVQLLAVWLVAGCNAVEPPPPDICELGGGELVIFPDDADRTVPTSVIIRILSGGSVNTLDVGLFDEHDLQLSGTATLIPTDVGDLLEWVPLFSLAPNARYRLEVMEFDQLVATSTFTTESSSSSEDPITSALEFLPLSGDERRCCSGDTCRDGTAIHFQALPDNHMQPQLALVVINEVVNTRCGPSSREIGVLPVVIVGDEVDHNGIFAETDLILDGCYDIDLITQTGTAYTLGDGTTCADGQPFVPSVPAADCTTTQGGCHCQTGTQAPLGATVWLGLGVWLATRRRGMFATRG